ncbi:MAG: twin-arginine translocation signal domain-containing protein, partial [Calditrichaeota bacterium]
MLIKKYMQMPESFQNEEINMSITRRRFLGTAAATVAATGLG